MSEVHLVIIKNRKIYFITKHYREIQQILENNNKIRQKGKYLDAGYIVIDFDNKDIVNCQEAFALKLI
jgi:uncharacterized pyridoxamine 5'-phosphate oxidase family protein